MQNLGFSLSFPRNIIFGPGKFHELPILLKNFGNNVLYIGIADQAIKSRAESIFFDLKKKWKSYEVRSEPSIESIEKIYYSLKDFQPNVVVAIGGGSVIDTGKVLAALLTNDGVLMDFLEVVGKGKPLGNRSIPIIAIPTTAGTGSEVTRNAVIDVPKFKMKVSLRSPYIQPEIALIDPELTLSLPIDTTMNSGMDAFIQVIEPYLSIKSNPFTDILCLDGIRKAASALPAVFQAPYEIANRNQMSWISLLGGICLANAGLGAIHGFAGVIGGMSHLPHGAICASLLPAVISGNIKALKTHSEDTSIFYYRYQEIFRLVLNKQEVSDQEGMNWFRQLNFKFNIPSLKELGISKKEFPEIVGKTIMASSTKANCIILNENELDEILENAYEN